MPLGLTSSAVVVFAVSMLLGGLGKYVSVHLLTGDDVGPVHALVSVLLGSAVWAVVAWLFAFPFAAPIAALATWAVVDFLRYSAGPVRAGAMAVVTWVVSVAALWGLAYYTVIPFEAIGIPGV